MKPFISLCLFLTLQTPILAQEKEPDSKLIRLQQSWEKAVERARKPIDDKYKMELKKLLASHTRGGRLDEALEVQTELERIGAVEKPIGFKFQGKWTVTNKGDNDRQWIEIVTDTTITDPKGNRRRYHIEGNKIRINRGGGWHELEIEPGNQNLLIGTNSIKEKIIYSRVPQ